MYLETLLKHFTIKITTVIDKTFVFKKTPTIYYVGLQFYKQFKWVSLWNIDGHTKYKQIWLKIILQLWNKY